MSVGNQDRDLRTGDGAADGRGDASGDLAGHDPAVGTERDEAFLALVRAGESGAFGLLFDAWADPVYDRLNHQGFTTADVAELSTSSFAAAHRRVIQHSSNDPFRVVIIRSVLQESRAASDRRVTWRMPVGPYA